MGIAYKALVRVLGRVVMQAGVAVFVEWAKALVAAHVEA